MKKAFNWLLAIFILFGSCPYHSALAVTVPRYVRHTYISHSDGKPDIYAIQTDLKVPSDKKKILLVYLHGMGDSYLEPLDFPNGSPVSDAIVRKYPSLIFASLDYGHETSWCNDKAILDINDNIRELCKVYPIEKIVMMGSSMGACSVMLYSTIAPPDIKNKIVGVVACEGAGDLRELYDVSGYIKVKPAMEGAFGGTPEQVPAIYRRKSFLRNLPTLNQNIRIFIISGKQDTTVPPRLQQEIVDALNDRDIVNKFLEGDWTHGVLPAPVYIQGLDFVLGNSTDNK